MYQVYHKNSTATSVLAWGYREILASPSTYVEENKILNDLSAVIDEARETEDQEERTELYKEAMGYVLDLAVELPVYQRKQLYAYNANVIDSTSFPAAWLAEKNEYTWVPGLVEALWACFNKAELPSWDLTADKLGEG
jgi:peptide/nickel transport system substrate-binding protein